VPGAARLICELLSRYGLIPDEIVQYQSQQSARHWQVLQQLIASGAAFACHCSRSELGGQPHFGRCKTKPSSGRPHSYRFDISLAPETIEFIDLIQGQSVQNLWQSVGDFVLWRADSQPSYQLACVVDDADAGISEVIRGLDLLDSTARQIALQHCLHLPTPRYAHLPLVIGSDGQKLSKQNLAPELDPQDGPAQLKAALEFLGQAVPDQQNTQAILAQATQDWCITRVPRAERR